MGVCSVGHIAGDLKWSGVDKFCEWLLERIAYVTRRLAFFCGKLSRKKCADASDETKGTHSIRNNQNAAMAT